jgi:hypothetical protein
MRAITGLLILTLALVAPANVFALIMGGEGNTPVTDPGWPKGAAGIFNHVDRAAWWEGPPFGGGEWHAECRGDTKVLNAVLIEFAKLDVTTKRVVVHDGFGSSFWLAPNQEPEKLAPARIDWTFQVWQPDRWENLHKLPVNLNPTAASDKSPPAQIDVFTANIHWADVVIPAGMEVIDQRLEAHGFNDDDGFVIEGRAADILTSLSVLATMQLQRIEPQKTGGYLYPVAAEAKTNPQGRWVVKNLEAGWYRVVVEAEGFVPRVAGHVIVDTQPQWKSFDTTLARSALVSGRVTDESGKPLADVEVRFDGVASLSGERYEPPIDSAIKTDSAGRFHTDHLPVGKTTIWIHKAGYCRPGLGLSIAAPADDIELKMVRSTNVRVTVDFGSKPRPADYLVKIEPEGGEAVGKYGGSGSINEKNEIAFKSVPPGKYTLKGQPNPSSAEQSTEPLLIDLKGGDDVELVIKPR